jgi:hypothetical protein
LLVPRNEHALWLKITQQLQNPPVLAPLITITGIGDQLPLDPLITLLWIQ